MLTAQPVLDIASMLRVDGEVAVVTGASSGLGERFARVLHAAGATVVAVARRQERLDHLAAALGDDRIVTVACDIAADTDRERLGNVIADLPTGGADILVNNAGVADARAAEDEPADVFRRVVEVNLTSLFLVSQLVARRMLEQGAGTIVNIASIYGIVASAPFTQASYCASKAGVVNLTRELACQWATRGVRVNAIAPGFFDTEMTASVLGTDSTAAHVRRSTPLGRPGAAHELDAALLFLASSASSYITGQVLAVDGGWTAR